MAAYQDPDKTEIKPMVQAENYPCLEILSGPRGKGRFPILLGRNQIGRSDENAVVLDDSSVSRIHAAIELSETGAATLSDLGSRNGTKIAGKKIEQPVPLAHETRIKIGLYLLRFLTKSAEPAAREEEPEEPKEVVVHKEVGLDNPDKTPPQGIENVEFIESAADEAPTPKKRSSWILYLVLIGALVATLVLGWPQVKKVGKFFAGKKTTPKHGVKESGQAGTALPANPTPLVPAGPQPVFLDFSSAPIPAQVYFGEQQMGVTPFRQSSTLAQGKWYEVRALFSLPEIGEVLEEKNQFNFTEGANVIPISFIGKIGVFKIATLPRDAQIYLEGYFEKDPYRAKPIKFAEIVFGKPIYVPYGRYIVELRKNRQLGTSQTYLDEVVYRREFFISKDQTNYTVDVNDEALKTFPVQISSIPPGARVIVDEKEVGVTPYSGSFPVGEHLLTMKKDGYFDFAQVVKMETNMPYVAEIPLKTSEAGELINKANALMKEDRSTEALPILVDAFSKNPSPLETSQISYLVGLCYLKQKSYKEAESYFLKAMTVEDYKYAARLGIATLTFEQGDQDRGLQLLVEVLVSSEDPKIRSDAGALFQKISPLKSVLYITSDPAGARVLVNGIELGQQTPLILHDLGVGSYRVQIQKPGFEESEMKLNLGVSEFKPVIAKLKKSG